ncbi:MAG: methyltransferase [Propionibacteriaceae bacterium]|nr:methyltransferase [Propionibacteriaceae bacterium]
MTASDLRHRLLQAGYTTDDALERIGALGQAGLGRNTTIAADVALAGAMDPLACLVRLFILQQEVPIVPASDALDVDAAVAAGWVTVEGDGVRAVVDVRPYGSPDDGASGYLVSDLTPGMDQRTTPTRPDYVLGASPASLTLAEITMRDHVHRALDLGTGCGVQSLHLVRHAEEVVGTDLNPRALELARLGADLSDVRIDLREGSLFEPVAGERFDLIVSNPPYVMSPPGGDRLTYREGDLVADGLVEAIVRGAPEHLTLGGSLQLLTNWAILDGVEWADRLRGWVEGTGLDCWVIERERLDVFSYIEMWLTDAGLAGSDQWEPAYREWLEYFRTLGISEVGMGWLLLTAAGRDIPHLRFESWPHAVAQPVGHVFARNRAAVDASTLPLDQLLASRPRLVDVVQETIGEPGAQDPTHVVLRQRTGLLRAIKVGTADGAVLGALDGDLTLGQVISAVASVLEVEAADVAAQVVPVVRDALLDQLLVLGQLSDHASSAPSTVG